MMIINVSTQTYTHGYISHKKITKNYFSLLVSSIRTGNMDTGQGYGYTQTSDTGNLVEKSMFFSFFSSENPHSAMTLSPTGAMELQTLRRQCPRVYSGPISHGRYI